MIALWGAEVRRGFCGEGIERVFDSFFFREDEEGENFCQIYF